MPLPGFIHTLVSRGLLVPAYEAYRAARGGYRHPRALAASSCRFRLRNWGWSPDRRREWMLERLRTQVRLAGSSTDFYRRRFEAAGFDWRGNFSFDEFVRIPPLDRSELAGHTEELHIGNRRDDRMDATGGSTGAPATVWKGPEERGWGEGGTRFFYERVGLRPGRRVAYLWGHHLDARDRDSRSQRWLDVVFNRRWYDCFRLSPEILREYDRELMDYRPDFVVAYAGALASLAVEAGKSGRRPGYPRHGFVTGAEKLWPHERQRILEVFGKPVFEQYGGRDVGLIGFQSPGLSAGQIEIDWVSQHVEPESQLAEANVLVTKLHADTFPLIRYRVGDVARFPASSAPGHPVFQLDEVIGRELEGVWTPAGGWFHGIIFPHFFKDLPVREFQVVQEEDYAVTASVIPDRAATPEDLERIRLGLERMLPGLTVTLRLADDIPRTPAGKRRAVITKIRRHHSPDPAQAEGGAITR